MRIAMIGTGYVGLVTATCFSEMGNDVRCYDIDAAKIAALNEGKIPIYEPGLQEMLARNVREGRLVFSTEITETLSQAEVCFITVGTPADAEGSADKHYVLDAAENIAHLMQAALVVVIKSTVPVGTCVKVEALFKKILAERGVSLGIDVVSNPEFLKEGKAVEDFMRPDRIVIGTHSERGYKTMEALYKPFVRNGHPIISMGLFSAEMTKYAANVMLATRISLMNEIALICERVGADIMDVRRGVGSDKRLGMAFLYAGIGYGGSCFPKDVKALSRMAVEAGCPDDLLEAVDKVNRYQKVLLANRVYERLGDLAGKKLAIWGLAFKPQTDDMREAPSLAIIKRLLDLGASVVVYDPEATQNARRLLGADVLYAPSMYAALEQAEALLLVTEWPQFRRPDFAQVKKLLKQPLIFDGRNQYEPREMQALGFEYHCIGRG
jgi:UDPglucose 6-dehydrogenase